MIYIYNLIKLKEISNKVELNQINNNLLSDNNNYNSQIIIKWYKWKIKKANNRNWKWE